jgi:hypothetical protein
MTTVSRTDFTNTLNRRGGYIDLRTMSPELRRAFNDAGISDDQLREIAGQDQVIRGSREFENLFRRIDQIDTNGSSTSIATRDAAGGITRAGRVYDSLTTEADSNRARAAREGGRRFAGEATLDQVLDGRSTITTGARGEHVRRVQQALIDMGYGIPTNGASGVYDRETQRAVSRFQREMGLGVDGNVGAETLGALAATAPPPGHRLERSADYDRLYSDGRLDIAIAIGYDEGGSHAREQREILSGLRRDGWRPLDYSRLSADDRRRYGLTADRYDPNAQYFAREMTDPRTGQRIDAVIRMVTPGTDGARARRSFEQALQQDEVVYYSGHARYGTGPDFDDINRSGAGNFVVDPRGNPSGDLPPAGLRSTIRGRGSDLTRMINRPDYQVLVFNGCTTENYLNNLRNPAVFGRNHQNTDIVTTTMPTSTATGGPHAMRFIQGITSREGNGSMFGAMSSIEQSYNRRVGSEREAQRAGHTFTESGFISNPGNRVVRAP